MAKTKSQKDAEAKRKQRRYRTIVNATGDPKLARKYRNKSDVSIELELGIKVPKRKPRLIKEERRGKQTKKVRNYIVSTPTIKRDELVFTSKIFKGRKVPRVTTKVKEPKVARKAPGAVESLFKPYFTPKQDARQDKWGEWSGNKKKLIPKAIRTMAFRINRRAGLKDDSAAYGYAVLYYAYVNNEPIDLWLTRLVPDTDFDGELYLNVSGFGVKR